MRREQAEVVAIVVGFWVVVAIVIIAASVALT